MYDVIAMDPPWPERGGGRIKRGADRHYDVVEYRDIPTLVADSPLWSPNDPCLVFCWTTVASCEYAYKLLRMLRVTPVTKLYWLKDRSFESVCPDGCRVPGITTGCKLEGKLGLGQYVRHDVEEVVVGRIGRVRSPKLAERSWVLAPTGAHSEKPQAMYDLFELLAVGAGLDGPRAELFARRPRDGWKVWGNEVGRQNA